MTRKRRTLLLLFFLLAVLMAVSAGAIYRDDRQQGLNQALIAALKESDVAAEVRLLNAGADANARDMGDQPVTFWGVLKDYWKRLRTGEPAETEFHTPAILVFRNKYETILPDEKAWIALTVPLLNHGANINSQDEDKNTVLSRVCPYDFRDLARLLIDRGADVNSTDGSEVTPLVSSINHGDLELVRALLKAGAKVNIASGQGTELGYARFLLQDAKEYDHKSEIKSCQEIIRLLQQAGAHE